VHKTSNRKHVLTHVSLSHQRRKRSWHSESNGGSHSILQFHGLVPRASESENHASNDASIDRAAPRVRRMHPKDLYIEVPQPVDNIPAALAETTTLSCRVFNEAPRTSAMFCTSFAWAAFNFVAAVAAAPAPFTAPFVGGGVYQASDPRLKDYAVASTPPFSPSVYGDYYVWRVGNNTVGVSNATAVEAPLGLTNYGSDNTVYVRPPKA
jgi:hypothetical protein